MAKKDNKKESNAEKGDVSKNAAASSKGFSPVLKFILGFLACIAIFYSVYYASWFETSLKNPILGMQATVSAFLLNLFGYSVSVANEVLSGDGSTVKIAGGCDGLEATALFIAAVLVFPLPFKFKWPGMLAGFVILSIVNILRIAGLFLTQKYWPEAFDFMHIQGGLYLYSIITILLMLIWADWALRNNRKEQIEKT